MKSLCCYCGSDQHATTQCPWRENQADVQLIRDRGFKRADGPGEVWIRSDQILSHQQNQTWHACRFDLEGTYIPVVQASEGITSLAAAYALAEVRCWGANR